MGVYRIVQELLNNATKHSKATKIDINLENTNTMLLLNYRDNGVGMNIDYLRSTFRHMGLSGIKERVLSLEGEIHIKSASGEGFEVSILIPILPLVYIHD